MSEKSVIEAKLRKKEAEVQSLEDKLRSARIYVHALNDILKELGKDASPETETEPKAGSMTAQARDAIKQAGCPLHVNELLKAIGKSDDAKASLTGSLAAYVRREEVFTRPAPNTYGLIELGHTAEAQAESEPPSGFGARPATTKQFGGNFDDDLDDDPPF